MTMKKKSQKRRAGSNQSRLFSNCNCNKVFILLLFQLQQGKVQAIQAAPNPRLQRKPQKKMSNHLTASHPHLSASERERALREAVVVSKHTIKADAAQTKLPFSRLLKLKLVPATRC